ncbi:MAG: hypothetical protein KDD60_04365 [Bdellovibrionales bacterium]|nr:hypothetical protein [Bdellovibrionales bacterium]
MKKKKKLQQLQSVLAQCYKEKGLTPPGEPNAKPDPSLPKQPNTPTEDIFPNGKSVPVTEVSPRISEISILILNS